MSDIRRGKQTPTICIRLPYSESLGTEAVDLYNQSNRTAQDWQVLMLEDIMAVNTDGLWLHMKAGWSIPRRNGKSEILIMRVIWDLTHERRALYTLRRVAQARPDAAVFATGVYKGCYNADKRLAFNQAVERCVRVLDLPNLFFLPPDELLPDPCGLAMDACHPSDYGHMVIAGNLVRLITAALPERK